MSGNINPYEAPQTIDSRPSIDSLNESGPLLLDGKMITGISPITFPLRCIHCNQPVSSDAIKKENKDWIPSWVVFLLPLFVFPAVLASLFFMKKCELTYALCMKHNERANKLQSYGRHAKWVLPIIIIAFVLFGAFFDSQLDSGLPRLIAQIFLTLLFLALAALVVLTFMMRSPLSLKKHKKNALGQNVFWIKGCGDEFLNSIKEDAKSAQQE